MNKFQSFKNHFLVAMPNMEDPNFQRAVTYICEHDENGAIGIVINKPVPITLGEILHNLKIPVADNRVEQYPVLFGGPVAQEQGFVLHSTKAGVLVDENLLDNDKIVVSSSKKTLKTIADGQGPTDLIFTLGYASWVEGQLETEIGDNAWLVTPADNDILFHVPFNKRWQVAASLIGVDFAWLSSDAGHA